MILNLFDPMFVGNLSWFLPLRKSEHYNALFPAMLDTAGEVSDIISSQEERALQARAIIRHYKKVKK